MLLRLALACALTTLIVAVVATLDHRHKVDVENAASVDAWFCAHGHGERCSDFDVPAYEQRWERREVAYESGVVVLGATALVLGVGAALRSRA